MLSAPAQAIVLRMSPEQLVRSAATVAVVVPEAGRPQAVPGAPLPVPSIETAYDLKVTSSLKGRPTRSISLVERGGTLGRFTTWVEDAPSLMPGRAVVVFLDTKGRVVGGWQGVVPVCGDRLPSLGVTISGLRQMVRGASRNGSPLEGAIAPGDGVMRSGTPVREPGPGSLAGATPDELIARYSAAPPVISSITPTITSANTGSKITISGSGFGSERGLVGLFWGRDPGATGAGRCLGVEPDIGAGDAWSDTAITLTVPNLVDSTGYEAAPGSGPVVIQTASGALSAPIDVLSVQFGWFARWQRAARSFAVNPNYSKIASSAIEAAALTGVQSWNPPSAFTFAYAGPSTRTTLADPDTTKSEAFWGSLPDGVIGEATSDYDTRTHQYRYASVMFNDSMPWSVTGARDAMDLQTIAAHEFGHIVGLTDKYGTRDGDAVMYGFADYGEVRRLQTPGDLAGPLWIYGPRAIEASPTITALTSSTHPDPSVWYRATEADFAWTSSDPHGTDGYSTLVDGHPLTIPKASVTTTHAALVFAARNARSHAWADGIHYLHVRAHNAAGWGAARHLEFRVDGTAPVTSATRSGSTVRFKAKDAASGVATTCYSIDGGGRRAGVSTTSIAPGSHKVDYYSVDKAGNAEASKHLAFTIPRVATQLTITSSTAQTHARKAFTVSGRLTHAGAGETVTVQARLSSGAPWSPVWTLTTGSAGTFSGTFTPSSFGTYRFRAVFSGTTALKPSTSRTLSIKSLK